MQAEIHEILKCQTFIHDSNFKNWSTIKVLDFDNVLNRSFTTAMLDFIIVLGLMDLCE